MKKVIYVFLILMLSVNYLYAQGVDSKEKKPSKNSEIGAAKLKAFFDKKVKQ